MFYKILVLMRNPKLKQIIEPFKAICRTANDLSYSIDRRSRWPRKWRKSGYRGFTRTCRNNKSGGGKWLSEWFYIRLYCLLTVNVKWEIGKQIVGTSLINAVLDAFIDFSIVQNGIEKNSNEFSKQVNVIEILFRHTPY